MPTCEFIPICEKFKTRMSTTRCTVYCYRCGTRDLIKYVAGHTRKVRNLHNPSCSVYYDVKTKKTTKVLLEKPIKKKD